jgi:hypothetical protein
VSQNWEENFDLDERKRKREREECYTMKKFLVSALLPFITYSLVITTGRMIWA